MIKKLLATIVALSMMPVAVATGTKINTDKKPYNVSESSDVDTNSSRQAWLFLFDNANNEIPYITAKDKPDTIKWNKLPIKQLREKGTLLNNSDETDRTVNCRSSHVDGTKSYKLKDALITPLSYFGHGENLIFSGCFGERNKECYVWLHHTKGESIFNFELRFKTIDDKIDMNSLFCVLL
jgi:hypothetical protein